MENDGLEAQALRKAGLKITSPRLKMLRILTQANPHHMSAEAVYKILVDAGEDVGLATVYRVLTQFEQVGLVVRHGFVSGHAMFELNSGDHHDHLVCLKCGKVEEFMDALIESRQQEIAQVHNFEITAHSHYLYGKCTNCQ